MLIIITGYMKLTKGIFALDGRDGKTRTQKNLDKLERQAESDKVKFSSNKHRILELCEYALKTTTNNSSIKIIPDFSLQGA